MDDSLLPPESQRISRTALFSRSSSPSTSSSPEADPELSRALEARLLSLYGPLPSQEASTPAAPAAPSPTSPALPISASRAASADDEAPPPPSPEEPAFEFRLFSTSASQPTAQKIILPNDTLDDSTADSGAFVNPHRTLSLFLAAPAEGRRKREFEETALSADDVLGLARKRWKGMEMPWKVRVLRVSKKEKRKLDDAAEEWGLGVALEEQADEGNEKKGRKPNKKRRIVLRERKRKAEEKAAKAQMEKELKEEAERAKAEAEKEKRTRKNREKKLRQKAKEKEKKELAKAAGGGAEAPG